MWTRLWNKLIFLFRRDRFDRELNEEIDFHREMLETTKTEDGCDHREAVTLTSRQLGNTVTAREDAAASWLLGGSAVLSDLRDAVRNLRVGKSTSLLALTILTLGITAATVTFSVVDAVALRRLPYQSPERLVAVATISQLSSDPGAIASQDYFAMRDHIDAFDGLAAARLVAPLRLQLGADSATLVSAAVTSNFFEVLGVRALLGRTFTADEDLTGNDHVAILSYDTWMRRFGGNPGIVGQPVMFQERPRRVIGVMPKTFGYSLMRVYVPDAWIPYVATSNDRSVAFFGRSFTMQVIGRLRGGATIGQARAEVEQVTAMMVKEGPKGISFGNIRYMTMPLHDFVVGRAKPWLLLLLVSVGLVLLVSFVNVANLLLARATVRRREFATREALGASRARLARTLVFEGLVLSCGAATAGLAASVWGVAVAKSLLPHGLARASDIALDARVLLVSIGTSLACGLLFSAAPAWQASRSDVSTAIKNGGSSVIGGRGHGRWLGVFLVAEVAFVVTLLVASGLVVTSFIRITTADLGFDRNDVLTFNVSKPMTGIPRAQQPAAAETFRNDVLDRTTGVPGVVAAAIVNDGTPLSVMGVRYGIKLPNGADTKADDMLSLHPVTSGYFKTMGLRLLRGRTFEATDRAGGPLVTVINDVAARRFFGQTDPVGQTITFRGPTTIVGVVHAVRLHGPEVDLSPEFYLPLVQDPDDGGSGGSLVVRVTQPTPTLVARIGEAIKPALGGSKLPAPEFLEDTFRKLTADRRFNAGLLSIFGLVATVIAAIGIYGVMAFVVAQQVRTIGLQIALGASSRRVLGDVIREAARYVAIGVALGLIGARAISSLFASLVFGITTTDARVYLGVAVVLGAIGFLAALVPAIRATRVDPLVALRAE